MDDDYSDDLDFDETNCEDDSQADDYREPEPPPRQVYRQPVYQQPPQPGFTHADVDRMASQKAQQLYQQEMQRQKTAQRVFKDYPEIANPNSELSRHANQIFMSEYGGDERLAEVAVFEANRRLQQQRRTQQQQQVRPQRPQRPASPLDRESERLCKKMGLDPKEVRKTVNAYKRRGK
jgi:hypothetical protein